jgi:carbon monoxide dehydrogenase subunit G
MQLKHVSKKSPDQLFLYLTDMHKFAEVHPVIYKAEKISEIEYRLYEKIKFLFIPFSFSYKVKIEKVELMNLVILSSKVQRGVYLELSFFLNPVNGRTEIEETIYIKAPVIIKQIFSNTIKKVHKELFENIEKK